MSSETSQSQYIPLDETTTSIAATTSIHNTTETTATAVHTAPAGVAKGGGKGRGSSGEGLGILISAATRRLFNTSPSNISNSQQDNSNKPSYHSRSNSLSGAVLLEGISTFFAQQKQRKPNLDEEEDQEDQDRLRESLLGGQYHHPLSSSSSNSASSSSSSSLSSSAYPHSYHHNASGGVSYGTPGKGSSSPSITGLQHHHLNHRQQQQQPYPQTYTADQLFIPPGVVYNSDDERYIAAEYKFKQPRRRKTATSGGSSGVGSSHRKRAVSASKKIKALFRKKSKAVLASSETPIPTTSTINNKQQQQDQQDTSGLLFSSPNIPSTPTPVIDIPRLATGMPASHPSYVPPLTWVFASKSVLVFAYTAVVINAITTAITLSIGDDPDPHAAIWASAAIFVSIAVPISLFDIHMHMLHYVNPLQRYYIRILAMVPIYAVESYLALRFKEQRVYLETAREAYEAFVIYSFTKLMIEFLGPRRIIIAKLQAGPYEASGMRAINSPSGNGKRGRGSGSGSRGGGSSSSSSNNNIGGSGSATNNGDLENPSSSSSTEENNTRGLRGIAEVGDVITYQLAPSDEQFADEQEKNSKTAGTAIGDNAGTSTLLPGARKNPSTPSTISATSTRGMTPTTANTTLRDATAISIIETNAFGNSETTPTLDLINSKNNKKKRGKCVTFFSLLCGISNDKPTDGFATMLPPFCCLRRWRLGADFLRQTSFGVLQYVVLRTILAVVTLILEDLDKYGDGDFSNTSTGYLYVVILLNISQTWALYCLAIFAYHLWEHLKPMNPLGKFLIVKWVIFASWWQSVIISLCVALGVQISLFPSSSSIPATASETTESAAELQDFLICLEMCAAALLHHMHFSYTDFHGPKMTQALAEAQVAFQLNGDEEGEEEEEEDGDEEYEEDGDEEYEEEDVETARRGELKIDMSSDEEEGDEVDVETLHSQNSKNEVPGQSNSSHSSSSNSNAISGFAPISTVGGNTKKKGSSISNNNNNNSGTTINTSATNNSFKIGLPPPSSSTTADASGLYRNRSVSHPPSSASSSSSSSSGGGGNGGNNTASTGVNGSALLSKTTKGDRSGLNSAMGKNKGRNNGASSSRNMTSTNHLEGGGGEGNGGSATNLPKPRGNSGGGSSSSSSSSGNQVQYTRRQASMAANSSFRASTSNGIGAGGGGGMPSSSSSSITTKQFAVQEGGHVTEVREHKAGVFAALQDILPVDVVTDTAEHLAAAGAAANSFLKKTGKQVKAMGARAANAVGGGGGNNTNTNNSSTSGEGGNSSSGISPSK